MEQSISMIRKALSIGITDIILTPHYAPKRGYVVKGDIIRKKFEENKRGTLQEVHDYFNEKIVKGEIVLVLEGKS